jgi:acyl-CoA dehydrogenase
MGGVQEALARIGSEAFILTSAQQLVNSMLGQHEQPAVLSAVMKYETTHRSRQIVNGVLKLSVPFIRFLSSCVDECYT